MRRLLLLLATLFTALAVQAQDVLWNAPSSAASGTSYWVGADSTNGGTMTIRKNGLVFATGGGGVAGAFSTDTGAQTVNYWASGTDVDNINFSGAWAVTIVGSNFPGCSLSYPNPVTVGQVFNVTVTATDVDGDLNSLGLRWQGFGLQAWWGPGTGSSFTGVHTMTAPTTAGTMNIRCEVWDNAGHGTTGAWETITVLTPTTFTFGNLSHTYDGLSKTATVTANPATATFTPSLNGGPNAGDYTVSATATGNYTGSGSATLSIAKAPQATVTVAPASSSITVGGSVTFTASGGSGTGAYTWGGSASGTGTSKTVSFPTAGTFSVTVFRATDTNYLASDTASATVTVKIPTTFTFGNLSHTYDGFSKTATVTANPSTATFTPSLNGGPNAGDYTVSATATGNYTGSGSATLTIAKAPQASVSILPPSSSITVGNSVTFTASGGSGTGAYNWGGSASGTGTSKTVTFNTTGAASVTVFRAADTNYLASNTATASVTVNPNDTTAPSVPTELAASAITSTSFTLSWTASTDAGGVTAYEVFRDSLTQGTVSTTSMNLTGLTSGTTYSVTVRARDAANNWSAQSTALSVTTLAAPTITTQPTSQTVATGASATFTVAATGTAPTYQWRKNAVNLANGGNVSGATAATLTLTNAQAADAASYTVVVTNSAGSATSAAATLTVTADTTAPTVPAGLASSAITATSFTLSWTASTDNVSVTAYEVFKGGVSQGTVATTSMSLTGLTSGTTYSMTVRARDAANNWSLQSTALSVTTTVDNAADNDGDGVPNGIETQLGTNPNSAAQSDTTNQTQTKIHRPKL